MNLGLDLNCISPVFDVVGVHLSRCPNERINSGDVEDDREVDSTCAGDAEEVGVSALEYLQFEFEYAKALELSRRNHGAPTY